MAGVTSGAVDGTPAPVPGLRAAVPLVVAGGTVGALARAALAQGLPTAAGGWPWVTLAVNVTGSLLLGLLLAVLRRGPDVGRRRAVRLGVGTGVLGGFTTYSAFTLEVVGLLTEDPARGLAYALVSVVGGVAAALVGIVVVERVVRPAAGPLAGTRRAAR